MVSPVKENVPTVQGWQVAMLVAFVAVEYFPAGQAMIVDELGQ